MAEKIVVRVRWAEAEADECAPTQRRVQATSDEELAETCEVEALRDER